MPVPVPGGRVGNENGVTAPPPPPPPQVQAPAVQQQAPQQQAPVQQQQAPVQQAGQAPDVSSPEYQDWQRNSGGVMGWHDYDLKDAVTGFGREMTNMANTGARGIRAVTNTTKLDPFIERSNDILQSTAPQNERQAHGMEAGSNFGGMAAFAGAEELMAKPLLAIAERVFSKMPLSVAAKGYTALEQFAKKNPNAANALSQALVSGTAGGTTTALQGGDASDVVMNTLTSAAMGAAPHAKPAAEAAYLKRAKEVAPIETKLGDQKFYTVSPGAEQNRVTTMGQEPEMQAKNKETYQKLKQDVIGRAAEGVAGTVNAIEPPQPTFSTDVAERVKRGVKAEKTAGKAAAPDPLLTQMQGDLQQARDIIDNEHLHPEDTVQHAYDTHDRLTQDIRALSIGDKNASHSQLEGAQKHLQTILDNSAAYSPDAVTRAKGLLPEVQRRIDTFDTNPREMEKAKAVMQKVVDNPRVSDKMKTQAQAAIDNLNNQISAREDWTQNKQRTITKIDPKVLMNNSTTFGEFGAELRRQAEQRTPDMQWEQRQYDKEGNVRLDKNGEEVWEPVKGLGRNEELQGEKEGDLRKYDARSLSSTDATQGAHLLNLAKAADALHAELERPYDLTADRAEKISKRIGRPEERALSGVDAHVKKLEDLAEKYKGEFKEMFGREDGITDLIKAARVLDEPNAKAKFKDTFMDYFKQHFTKRVSPGGKGSMAMPFYYATKTLGFGHGVAMASAEIAAEAALHQQYRKIATDPEELGRVLGKDRKPWRATKYLQGLARAYANQYLSNNATRASTLNLPPRDDEEQ